MSGMSMRGPDWMSLRGVDQRRLSEARLQAHHAVQWLARAARAYVPPQPDDEHTNLGWNGALGGFTTHPLKDGAWLSLKITDLTLALHVGEGSTHVQSFSLDRRSDAQARQWLSEQLGARGLDAHALDAPSPYDMPAHAISQGAAYGPAGLSDALDELAAWFGNAALLLGSIQRQMIGRKLAASPLRCCRTCQRSVIGICAISWRRLRRLIRSSRPRTNSPRPMSSCGPRSTARSRS